MEMQANAVAMLAGSSDKVIILVLMPQFTYRSGQLYLAEKLVSDLLSHRGQHPSGTAISFFCIASIDSMHTFPATKRCKRFVRWSQSRRLATGVCIALHYLGH